MDRKRRYTAVFTGRSFVITILLVLFLLPFELATVIWALRRSGFLPFPHGIMVYLLAGQIILILHVQEVLSYDFLRVYTTYAYIHHFRAMFVLMSAMFFIMTVSVPRQRIEVAAQIRALQIGEPLFWLLTALLYFSIVIVASTVNWNIAWSNSIYLTMTSERVLAIPNGVSIFVIQAVPLLGLLAAVGFTFAFYTNKTRVASFLFPAALLLFFYVLAAHSRAAAAYLIIAGLLAFLLSGKKVIAALLCVAGLLIQFSVLYGRLSGKHGIQYLPDVFSNIFLYIDVYGLDAISNIFEGVFVTSEYFARNFRYDTIYKVLSLSPLFSFIDGFDTIRDVMEIRLSWVVPNSAISEVLSFGPLYAVVYLAVQLMAGRLSAVLMVRQPGLLPLVLNAMVFLAAYSQFTYSTRTVFRNFVYALIACTVLILRDYLKVRRVADARHRDAGAPSA